MMPPIPAVIMLPTETAHGYWPATVVAAIPLGHGSLYAVTAIEPTSSPDAPRFFAATAGRNIHGHWTVDEIAGGGSLAGAIHDMTCLAGLTISTPPTARERMTDEARKAGYASLAEAEDAGDLTALADRLGTSLSDLDH